MSWDNLNGHELQAIRNILSLTVSEAAKSIAGLSGPRSWQRWEAGEYPVPQDVAEELDVLISLRNECIEGMSAEIIESGQHDFNLKWYHTFEAFLEEFPNNSEMWWRLHQSVCSYFFSEGGDVELLADIETNKESYIYKFFARTREEDLEWERQNAVAEKLGLN